MIKSRLISIKASKAVIIFVLTALISISGQTSAIPIDAYNQYKQALKDQRSKKFRKAKATFTKLANDHSYSPAMVELGIIEQKGYIGKPNYKKARGWMVKASKLDNPKAQYHLAKMFERGLGGEKNIDKAAKWRMRSAKLGNPVSQYDLGIMYLYGKGVEQNIEKATTWLVRSADKGYKYSKSRLYTMKRLLKSKKDEGDPVAHYLLGLLTRKGYAGFKSHDGDAYKLYSFAAEKGLANAQYELGQMYFYGRHVKKNHKKAAEFYKKASDKNHIFAMKKLAVMRLNKQGGLTDEISEILPLLEKTAEAAHQYSQRKLGYMYLVGDRVKQDKIKAYKLLLAAAKQNDAFSQRTLGQMYLQGNGVTKNLQEAAYWFTLAIENGDKDAKKMLKSLKSAND